MHRPITILIALAMLAAACSGGTPSGQAPQPGEAPETQEPAGPQPTRPPVSDIVDVVPQFDQADLFPCSIGALGSSQLVVVYAQAATQNDLGPNADRFRVLIDDYLDRCGGNVEVNTVDLASPGACAQIVELEPVLTVTDAASATDIACIVERTGSPLWTDAAIATSLVDASANLVVSTDIAPDVAAARAASLVRDEGLLEGRSVVIVHGSDPESTAVATDGLVPSLPGAELLAVDPAECGDPTLGADVIFAVLSPSCLAELAAATSGSPLWVIDGSDEILADSSLAALETVNERLDGALSYAALPVNGGGWPQELNPAPRDKACNRRLDALVGTSTVYPGLSWSAGARLCATTQAVLQALASAGEDPSVESVSDALTSVSGVVLPRGLAGATDPTEPWLVGDEIFALEWSSDCGCWNFVAGPLVVVD